MSGTNTVANSFIAAFEQQILNPLITLVVLAAFVLFIWGVVEYVRNAANDEKRKIGQQHIIWGLVGLVIIFGAGALVKIIQSLVSVFQ